MAVLGGREPLLSWKRSCFALVGLISLVLVFNAFHTVRRRTSQIAYSDSSNNPSQRLRHFPTFGNSSVLSEGIDGLTDAECIALFPDLYTDIDQALQYWKARGHTISVEDTDVTGSKGSMRLLIHDNQLRVLASDQAISRTKAVNDRALGVLQLIQRALDASMAAGETLPTIEFAFDFKDEAKTTEVDPHSSWTFAKAKGRESHRRIWLFPNFDFWHYGASGSMSDAKLAAMQHDLPFAQKIQKVVWRGATRFGSDVRLPMMRAGEGKEWADFAEVTFMEDPPLNYLPQDALCSYAATVYTEGETYSGRLKHLMNCRSLLFVHDTKYATHYSHLLVPDGQHQNFVAVRRDWTDLEEKVKYYLARPEEAERVIENMLRTFRSRYTTRAATSCYIRRLIRSYGEVSFAPEPFRSNGRGGVEPRGFSYEKFMNWNSPEDLNYEELGWFYPT